MTKQTKISVNLDGLEKITKQADGWVAKIGIMGDSNSRDDGDDMGNAEIGLVHELGSETNNIPQRSFLRMPIEAKGKQILKAAGSGKSKSMAAEGDYKGVMGQLGLAAEVAISEAFDSGGFGQWPQLDTDTIRAKGSSGILKDTRQLQRSITSEVVRRGEIDG